MPSPRRKTSILRSLAVVAAGTSLLLAALYIHTRTYRAKQDHTLAFCEQLDAQLTRNSAHTNVTIIPTTNNCAIITANLPDNAEAPLLKSIFESRMNHPTFIQLTINEPHSIQQCFCPPTIPLQIIKTALP